MFFFNLIAISFTSLGLSPLGALFLLLAVMLGSTVNIPVSSTEIILEDNRGRAWPGFLFYYPPRTARQVIYVNLGGAVIPALFSLYLLFTRAPLWPTLLATLAMVIVSKRLAKPVPGLGISLPVFIPPLLAAILALGLSPDNSAPVAYVAGVLGTLIGADLLNIPQFKNLGSQVVSIGGAGVFDGIFLVGIIAALLS